MWHHHGSVTPTSARAYTIQTIPWANILHPSVPMVKTKTNLPKHFCLDTSKSLWEIPIKWNWSKICHMKLNPKHYFVMKTGSWIILQYIFLKRILLKLEKILKGSLDLISSPSPSVKIIGGKVCLRCKGKTLLGIVNKLFVFKSLLTTSSNVLPLHLSRP